MLNLRAPSEHPEQLQTMTDVAAVKAYLLDLQDRICQELADEDGNAEFIIDEWHAAERRWQGLPVAVGKGLSA